MKHPFWIVNLGLLSLLTCSLTFIYFSRVKIAKRESIEPVPVAIHKELKVAINIQKIYENDPFGTYVKELPKPQNLDMFIPFPTPPVQQKIVAPQIIEPEFLDPLQITLMGIIVVGSNDTKNRAIIQDDKTKQENTYKVGDVIQDAQLIRIFKNKVIILRLNGQQEVLYLREQDAQADALYTPTNEWSDVIKKVDDNNFIINPTMFVKHITNLTQFIDLLNTTTVYQKGKSIGLRIGQPNKQALAPAFGLQKGDIVTVINNIPTETTEQRLAIYKNITTLPVGHTIKVQLLRRNNSLLVTYTLDNFVNDQVTEQSVAGKSQNSVFLSPKNKTLSEQQYYAYEPTMHKLRKIDHKMILENGKNLLNI